MIYIFCFRLGMGVATTFFNEAWLEKDDNTGEAYKNWLLPSSNNHSQAICAICDWKAIDISNGVGQIVKHSNSKPHMKVVKTLQEKRKQNPKVCPPSYFLQSFCRWGRLNMGSLHQLAFYDQR